MEEVYETSVNISPANKDCGTDVLADEGADVDWLARSGH